MRQRALWTAAVIVAAVTTAATHASAAERYHDGFYLRLGGGFGLISDRVEADDINAEGTLRGATLVSELGLGGAVSPGLILGAGLFSHWLPEPRVVEASIGPTEVRDFDFGRSELHVFGFLIDYYTKPRSGFHLEGALGLAAGSVDAPDDTFLQLRDHNGIGLGLVGGLGYEWWVSGSWGLGFLGRLTLAGFSGEDNNGIEWTHFVVAPAILFTATFN